MEVVILASWAALVFLFAIGLAMAAGKPWPGENGGGGRGPSLDDVPPRPDLDTWTGGPLMYDPEVWERGNDNQVSEV